jgi:uncharacterized Zn-finger protein
MRSVALSRCYQRSIPVVISYLSLGNISTTSIPCRYATSGNLLVKSSVPPSLGSAATNIIADDSNVNVNGVPHSNSSLSPLKHRNIETPMEYIASIPPIEVDGNTAVCDGGGIPALGHPIEYIQLNKVDANAPETCKYCGLRFIQRHTH